MKKMLEQVIRTLCESNEPMTAAKLAESLLISDRSIRNHIKEINEISKDLIISSKNGYTIDKQKAGTLLSTSETVIPQTSNERVSYIINKIIKQGEIDSYDLCDELFISYSTLKAELGKIRRKISEFDLVLQVRNDILRIDGTEKNKRKLLSSIMYEESANHFVNYAQMDAEFKHVDILFIKNAITSVFNKNQFFINDYSLENLVLHTTITIDRLMHHFSTNEETGSIQDASRIEYSISKEIILILEDHFNVHFSESEIGEFALLVSSRATGPSPSTLNKESIRKYIGDECYELTCEIIDDFGSYFYIDLWESEFFVRFALHIKNLLIRSKNNYPSKNPLTDTIKRNCPLIYDASVHAAGIIYDRTGLNLSDDEIAYIAFHIGGELEIRNVFASRINAIIYCPGYYDLGVRLKEKIGDSFKDKLLVENLITEESELKASTSDLIISSMPLSEQFAAPVIVVNVFLHESDKKQIESVIERINQNKKKEIFRKHLSSLISNDLFEVRYTMKDKNATIHYMSEKLVRLGYVNDDYEAQILQRDEISSTAFDMFAIPHTMKMDANKTGISVLILEEPVEWNGFLVSIIVMLCFNRNERYIFNEIFEPITIIFSSKENIKKILKVKSKEEFISLLTDLI